jgi:hypothetical protein
MKNLEKGAATNLRLLLHQARVFARFLQRKFLRRRKVTKEELNSSNPHCKLPNQKQHLQTLKTHNT